jgi:Fic family protein
MLIPPKYSLTAALSQLLSSIEASNAIIDSIDIPPEVEMNIRRESNLRSSLYSARIEGNTLTLNDLSNKSSKDIKKIEVFNILRAINTISLTDQKTLKITEIKKYHKVVMQDLSDKPDLGQFRKEISAIFDSAGIAVYMPPPPSQIKSLMENLIRFINSDDEKFVPIRACLAHYIFEKIHPFLDGNGRIGRILLQLVLQKNQYGMKGLLSTEEYLDNHRADYYEALDNRDRDVTEYLEFMLSAIAETAKIAKTQITEKRGLTSEDSLLPRRAEILNIVRDHKIVNFDQIHRRFLKVNNRTLRYDIKKLVDAGFINKRGTTNGVYYEIKK